MSKQIFLFLFLINSLLNAQFIGTGSTSWHSIVVDYDGNVYNWGKNEYGELGDETNNDSNLPKEPVTIGTPMENKYIIAVAPGAYHSLALSSDGKVFSWGGNDDGELGNGTFNDSNLPTDVKTNNTPMHNENIVGISAGQTHSMALSDDGKVFTWGRNNDGQLGDGSSNLQTNKPVAVSTTGTAMEGENIIKIAAGYQYSLALSENGEVFLWGSINHEVEVHTDLPEKLQINGTPMEGKEIIDIVAGYYTRMALSSDVRIFTWGQTPYATHGYTSTPVEITTAGTPLEGKTITKIAVQDDSYLALSSDGTVFQWYDSPSIVDPNGTEMEGQNIVDIAGGFLHTLVLDSDGNLYTWGYNNNGQLGDGTYNDSDEPVKVAQQDPIPVELTKFAAEETKVGVELKWQTATETNNYGFEIQRFAKSSDWQKIGFVEGSGNSNSPKEYEFLDGDNLKGKVNYRLKQLDFDGSFEFSDIVVVDVALPNEFKLKQNYPNPFNPTTKIEFSLPKKEKVKLEVFNLLGKRVKLLIDEVLEPGYHYKIFRSDHLNSGVYFYFLKTESFKRSKKMIILK